MLTTLPIRETHPSIDVFNESIVGGDNPDFHEDCSKRPTRGPLFAQIRRFNTVVSQVTNLAHILTSNTSIEGCVCVLFTRKKEERRRHLEPLIVIHGLSCSSTGQTVLSRLSVFSTHDKTTVQYLLEHIDRGVCVLGIDRQNTSSAVSVTSIHL